MIRLPQVSAFTLLLLLSTLACSAPGGAGLPATPEASAADVEEGLQPALQVEGRDVESYGVAERMEALGVPAVSVAVIHDGRVAWARAWGLADVESGRAATTETLFQAASMSKPMAALAALVMAEAGEVSLDADVNAALSSWEVPENGFTAERPVTLRGLLSHTAGVTVHGFPGYAPGTAVPTPVQVLDGAAPTNTAPIRVDTVPGALWRYSGGGYTIAQQLLEDVAGTPYAALLWERVLEPLGMSRSTSEQPLPARFRDQAATAYRGDGSPAEGLYHTYPEMAAAGLWTTPSDYARYALGIQRALRGEDGAIVSRETAEDMLTEIMGGYGIGVGVTGAGDSIRFSHGGANAGFRSTFHGYPRLGGGIVVMTNSDNGGMLAQEIVLAAARVYGWPGLEPRKVTPYAVAPSDLDAYVGTYRVADVRLDVTRAGDRLLIVQDGGEAMELVPTEVDTFVHMGAGFTLEFERDEAGGVAAIRVGGTRAERVAAADAGAALSLEGEGLRVFLEGSGSARPVPFGTSRDRTMRILTRVQDQGPVEEGENPDCGVHYASWGNGLVVVFARDEFAGWSVARGSTLTTAAGVGLGSTRAELESAYAAQVEPSSLGIEFSAGGLAGALESGSADAPIIALWAGVACLGR